MRHDDTRPENLRSPFPVGTPIDVMDQKEIWITEDGEELRIDEMDEEELHEALDVLDEHIDELHKLYAVWELSQISADPQRSWFALGYFSELGMRTVRATDPEVWMDSTGLYRALLRAYMEA